ncbi:MAG: heavy metal-binding domain-containing protein, partial [Isosphaeraceae bacterium]
MTHQPSPGTETPLESPSPSTPFAHRVRLAVRTLQVRLRFILVLAAAFLVVGQWDSLRNYWDLWTRALVKGEAASRAVPPNSEYFCPMDPGIVSITPGKCDICHMALVRRKIGDTAPLPSGVVARMQFSPYRVQLAGIQTAPADYQPTARSATLDGLVRDDGLIACRLADHDRAVVVAGLPVEVV